MGNHHHLYGLAQIHLLEVLLPIINEAISELSFPVDPKKDELLYSRRITETNKENYKAVRVLPCI